LNQQQHEPTLSPAEHMKRAAAARALEHVQNGMKLGLGTGSTAKHFVDLLGQRVAQGLDVVCVPTSERTAQQALSLGITLSTLDDLKLLDLTVDGADEIDRNLSLIKGGGGALLREKIVAVASREMIVIADESKVVARLGQFPLPIEVNRFGLGATQALVQLACGAAPVTLRMAGDSPYITDGGHLILDAMLGEIPDAKVLEAALLAIPGVVETGLFIGICKRAYIASASGVALMVIPS
jgi:ribose 5-phosphate isomerase A